MCGRPRDRWARFIISWLGPNETEKVQRSHFVADYVDYSKFHVGLLTFFSRLDFWRFVQATTSCARTIRRQIRRRIRVTYYRLVDARLPWLSDGPATRSLRRPLYLRPSRCILSQLIKTRARTTPHQLAKSVQMAKASEVPRAAEYTAPASAASLDAMCAKTPNFAHFTMSFPNDCAMSAQIYPGNSGISHRRGSFRKSRDALENAHASSSYAAPLANPLSAPNTQWAFDPRNGAALRAPLELCVPKSQWIFSPYRGLVWTQPPRQLAPKSNHYAPLQQMNQLSSQHASRPATHQSAPYRSTTASSTRHAYPTTSSVNFPPPLPFTNDKPVIAKQSHAQQPNRSSSTINAVSSAGHGAP